MIGSLTAPVLVGALGGSGTRVFARLLRHAGVFMGADLNEAEDSEPVMGFYRIWLRRYLERGGDLEPREWDAASRDLETALGQHLGSFRVESGPWGVKVPRSILMLGFWHRLFPGLSFVHVLRNGLDMAYSRDRNQLRMVGDLVLTDEERRSPEPLQAISYWQRVNLGAADFGESRLGSRYVRIRFEDLCSHPLRAYERLREVSGASATAPRQVIEAEVAVPASLGRWRDHPRAEVERMVEIGRTALRRFGYLDHDARGDAPWGA